MTVRDRGITIEEAAEHFGWTETAVRNYVAQGVVRRVGELKVYRGSRILISMLDLERVAKRKAEKATVWDRMRSQLSRLVQLNARLERENAKMEMQISFLQSCVSGLCGKVAAASKEPFGNCRGCSMRMRQAGGGYFCEDGKITLEGVRQATVRFGSEMETLDADRFPDMKDLALQARMDPLACAERDDLRRKKKEGTE